MEKIYIQIYKINFKQTYQNWELIFWIITLLIYRKKNYLNLKIKELNILNQIPLHYGVLEKMQSKNHQVI